MAAKAAKNGKNLVIVESPAKSKTIQKILGNDFEVKASFGHIADLSKKKMGIDIANDFSPTYEISPEKKKVLTELKSYAKQAKQVRIATDEDREGEAIGRHVANALGLKIDQTPRIVFHEITQSAIQQAVKNPRTLNLDLVNAQQARRLLDRLVGFELSPVLRQKIKTGLSAGRVQSVAVRLIVEREREIQKFTSKTSYKIIADLKHPKGTFPATYKGNITKHDQARNILEQAKDAKFQVTNVTTKPGKRSPAAPFTTSTLQQEASRKLGFSVSRTMSVAQKLYEAGYITYMRTDSVNIAKSAVAQAAKTVEKMYGKKYSQVRVYKSKSKGAQEAHECIRPTHLDHSTAGSTPEEKKLYDLIWKRTIASQMTDAQIEKTIIDVSMLDTKHVFTAEGEVIIFDGFIKVYSEGHDDHTDEETASNLPTVQKGDSVTASKITATEKYARHPARYTEASLVKKLEEEGIGRPSTYAPTIATIQKRQYIIKGNKEGEPKPYKILTLQKGKITEQDKTVIYGVDKNKLFPTDVGSIVNDFLLDHFPQIMDYGFTADVEEEFDKIAEGKLQRTKMLKKFYDPFHELVEQTAQTAQRSTGERSLGTDPKSGKPVIARIGRYGPMVQIGSADDKQKPKFAALRGQSIETITLDEALSLFDLPKKLGQHEDKEITVGVGRFGPYIKRNNIFVSIKNHDPHSIDLATAIELIANKQQAIAASILKERKHNKHIIQIVKGRRGPYLKVDDKNYKLPKGTDIEKITPQELLKLIS